MKRTFTTIVCALLLVAMLAGCGSTGSTNPFDAKAKTFDAEGMQITLDAFAAQAGTAFDNDRVLLSTAEGTEN